MMRRWVSRLGGVASALIVAATLWAQYPLTPGLQNMDETKPLGTEDFDEAVIRQTRWYLKWWATNANEHTVSGAHVALSIRPEYLATNVWNEFRREHKSNGVHRAGFITAAMLGAQTWTNYPGTNGFVTLLGTGLTLQWAVGSAVSPSGHQFVEWPVPFSNVCLWAGGAALAVSNAILSANAATCSVLGRATNGVAVYVYGVGGLGTFTPFVIGIGK